MSWFVGLPRFLVTVGAGNAETPFAILPFFALRWVTAASRVMCSMRSSLLLTEQMMSLVRSGFCLS